MTSTLLVRGAAQQLPRVYFRLLPWEYERTMEERGAAALYGSGTGE
ncbi:hypothetical protein ACFPZL_06415 [Leucobacter soli]|uniref:Uncharacterized protein n=1 Tax=Leucobacter soli TaxID=2812850 RepID=A0A916JWL6_9MICO|nr:hypothetical protein [Leucobacter soli]CAG7609563.1 hypothetical protein LEUCIP111803_01218 [Leucobacter soli]